ncbi:MAG: AraC family transcriptional regulator [Acetatifactor sp.]
MEKQYVEKIVHVTEGHAYSLHETQTPPDCHLALYMHTHAEFEFLYLHSGKMEVCVGSKHLLLWEEEAVFIPSNVMHSATSDTACRYEALVFSDSFLLDFRDTDTEKYFPPSLYSSDCAAMKLSGKTSWEKNILFHLKCILQNDIPEKKELYVKGHLLLIWQQMHQYVFRGHETGIGSETTKNLQKVIRRIEASYNHDISLDELAGEAHMSRSHFCRQFKNFTNLTPMEYLNRYRIMKCCEYLIKTEWEIKHIIYTCGYNNVSYFNRVFKKETGCTPGEYRKLSGKG